MQFEIVMDHGETANKCTIAPLARRDDFKLIYVNQESPIETLTSGVLLHLDGKPLHELNLQRLKPSIAAIDCVWSRLPKLLRRLETPLPTLARIPDDFVTAYPRRSKKENDPGAGLATIEALFIASAFMGYWDESLFSEYYFGELFLAKNACTFASYEISGKPAPRPLYRPALAKNSHSRRINRGRASTVS